MDDDHLARLHLRANYESRRQVRLQVLNALEAIGQGGELVGGFVCFRGFTALSEPLRHATWPSCFKPDTLAHFNGLSDPVEFL
jgi:hypothetical protein